MKKGQISIDLIITLIILVIMIGTFTVILNDFRLGQERFFLENQLQKLSIETATFITSTNALTETTFTTKLSIPKVSYSSESKTPSVSIDGNTITFFLTVNGEEIVKSATFSRPFGAIVELNENMLVVRNE
jgi:hypothetical protein